jgi:hypothetical protein
MVDIPLMESGGNPFNLLIVKNLWACFRVWIQINGGTQLRQFNVHIDLVKNVKKL